MVPSSTKRVPRHTAEHINERIRCQTIARYAAAGPEAIDRRLAELDREWDISFELPIRTVQDNRVAHHLIPDDRFAITHSLGEQINPRIQAGLRPLAFVHGFSGQSRTCETATPYPA